MKNWNTVTHDDLVQEIIPGVTTVDPDAFNRLNYISYLALIGDLVSTGKNGNAQAVRKHFEKLFRDIYVQQCRVIKEMVPDEESIDRYMLLPATNDAIDRLVIITMQARKTEWDSFKRRFCSENGINPEDIQHCSL